MLGGKEGRILLNGVGNLLILIIDEEVKIVYHIFYSD